MRGEYIKSTSNSPILSPKPPKTLYISIIFTILEALGSPNKYTRNMQVGQNVGNSGSSVNGNQMISFCRVRQPRGFDWLFFDNFFINEWN